MTTRLDVLVLDDGIEHATASAAGAVLEAAGHRVHRCHPPGAGPFPCTGIAGDAPCPIQTGVDVAVVFGGAPGGWTEPGGAVPTGLVCAAREGIPLVTEQPVEVEGITTYAIGADGDIATAVRRASDHRFDGIRARIERVIARPLRNAGIDPAAVRCAVERDGATIRVRLEGPEAARALRQAIAVRAFDAIRPTRRTHTRVELTYTAVGD